MVWLGEVATGRDNNFNLIRILAAVAVLISHATPIALGPGVAEPLEEMTGHSLGRHAVAVFFALSGFLVAGSMSRAARPADFVLARLLRLYPCLIVSLLAVTLCLGPLVTALPRAAYLTDPATWRFLVRNLGLVQCQYTLPGVFAANPYPTVEGSIWTLVHEVGCYALLFAAGLAGLTRRPRGLTVALAGYALVWTLAPALAPGHRLMQWRDLSLPFAIGAALWHVRSHVPLSAVGVPALTLGAWLLAGTALGPPALALLIAYGTLWFGYLPGQRLRSYNRFGDYSYGLYLYAFPLQGLAVHIAGPMSPAMNVALSLPAALFCAVLSWHLVERPALALRPAAARGLRRLRPS